MLVEAFLANNCDKSKAMQSIGYSKNYSTTGNCSKLFARTDVLAEIKAQRLELVKKTGFTKEQAHVQLDEDRQFAKRMGQAGAAHSATSSKIRLYGMDQQDRGSEQTVIVISPPSPKRVESEIIENEV